MLDRTTYGQKAHKWADFLSIFLCGNSVEMHIYRTASRRHHDTSTERKQKKTALTMITMAE
jgi:hypothetical protein